MTQYFSFSEGKKLWNAPMPFSCLASTLNDTTKVGEWRLSLCQLFEGGNYGGTGAAYSGGLISEFKDASTWAPYMDSTQFGTAYLLVNATLGGAEA